MANKIEVEVPDALRAFDQLPDAAHVRQPVVEALYGCSSATVWRWAQNGIIPKPHKRAGITTWNVGELRRNLTKPQAA